ncbi:hypothetical protein ACOSP7_027385 [Xanthoceras sorbifolium]
MLFGTVASLSLFVRSVDFMVAANGLLLPLRWISCCCAKPNSLALISISLLLLFGRLGVAETVRCMAILPPSFHSPRFCRWSPPILGCFKLNTDAALDYKGNKTGLGAVIRDHSGAVVLSDMSSSDGLLAPGAAKAKAIFFGLLMAFEGGFLHLLLHSGAASIIDMINGKSVALSEIGLLTEDIRDHVRRFNGDVMFSFSPCILLRN